MSHHSKRTRGICVRFQRITNHAFFSCKNGACRSVGAYSRLGNLSVGIGISIIPASNQYTTIGVLLRLSLGYRTGKITSERVLAQARVVVLVQTKVAMMAPVVEKVVMMVVPVSATKVVMVVPVSATKIVTIVPAQ